ncbi:DUF859 family phage minor structural protein [Streptococcus suis]|uniref:DUF859 family phage minor structural protein n=1 Tax=Streptococcus suis TaxID=1307 RepID=UPI000C17C9EE|nr:DUF859 family phage minor structural protein [Streptococcus suis]
MTEYRQVISQFGLIIAQIDTVEISATLNQSKVRVKIYHKNLDGDDWNNEDEFSPKWYFYRNGGYFYGFKALFNLNGTTSEWTFTGLHWRIMDYHKHNNPTGLLLDKEIVVPHNPDGRKLFVVSATFKNDTGAVKQDLGTFSVTHQLQRIVHASTATISGNTMGSAVTLTINRNTSALTHKVYWSFGNLSGTISTNATTSATWTPGIAQLAPQFPNLTSGKAKIRLETYVGSEKMGEQTYEHVLNLPASVKPSLGGLTLLDGNQKASALNLGANTFVQTQSNIRPRFDNVNGVNGSTVVSYRAELQRYVNGNWEATSLSTNANNGLMGNANFTGRARVVAYVTDSRGRRSDTRTVELTYLPYHVPALSFKGDRAGSSNDRINVTRNIKIAPLTVNNRQKNTGRLTFDVIDVQTNQRTNGVGGSADWTGTTEHEKINWMAPLNGTYDVGRTYIVIGQLSDAFNTVTFEYRVGVEAVPASISKFGLAVGKEWSRGVLDVGGSDHLPAYFDCDIYVREKPIQLHQLTNRDGKAITVTGDWNNVLNTGFYMGYNLANQPTFSGMHNWKYVRVTKHLDTYVLQEAVDFNGAVVCYRVKLNNTWQPWKQLATTDMVGGQKHRLTADDGTAIMATGDWNNYLRTGFYVGLNLTNEPKFAGMLNAKYVKVSRLSDTFVLQEAIDGNGSVSCYRVKMPSGWQPWKQYVIATGSMDWTSTGTTGVHYKVKDGIVSLRINIASLPSGTASLGTIPTQYLPIPNQTARFQLASAQLVISANGAINTQYGTSRLALQTQVTWQI